MPELRGEERWAAACIEAALGDVQVVQHDDGSAPAMHDLDVLASHGVIAAVEVTAAADADSIELWKLINPPAQRWQVPELAGGWTVAVVPTARGRRLRRELPTLLRLCEQGGVRAIDTRWAMHKTPIAQRLASLGVRSATQGDTSFAGSIYPTIDLESERSGGIVADTGDALAEWLSAWTASAGQASNLWKLRNATADERHLFVLLPGFSCAPFAAADLLMRDDAPLPERPPQLPEPLDGVWAMSTWSTGAGFHWSAGTGWLRFEKVLHL